MKLFLNNSHNFVKILIGLIAICLISCSKDIIEEPCKEYRYSVYSNYKSAFEYCRYAGNYSPDLEYMFTESSVKCDYYKGMDTIIHYQTNCPRFGVITITNRIVVHD